MASVNTICSFLPRQLNHLADEAEAPVS